jgi:hypothetical protein
LCASDQADTPQVSGPPEWTRCDPPELSDAAGTATHALGLPGFVVLAAAEYGGELELLIETTESVTGCPSCGVVATLHDRKPRWVRDLPAGGRPVTLVWFKRV